MEKLKIVIISIIVVLIAVGVAYYIHNKNNDKTTNIAHTNQNVIQNELNNELEQNEEEYIGLEESVETPEESNQTEEVEQNDEKPEKEETKQELTGEEKAIDIVRKQYALEGQTVTFDHMEGMNYVIKINNGTALTWYLVDGQTWHAEEY